MKARIWLILVSVLGIMLCWEIKADAFPESVQVSFNEYRARTGGNKDSRLVFKSIMDEYKDVKDLTVTFAGERYDFYPDTTSHGLCSGIEISDRDGLTIEGNGAHFIFHGIMAISDITGSSDVTMKDFSVDWDRPIFSQCEVVEATDDYIDVHIDSEKYPCYISGKRLIFPGEGWELPIAPVFINIYDSNGDIQYNTWDGNLGSFADADVEALGGDKFRFHYHSDYKPSPGSIIALIHKHYAAYGIRAYRSRNVVYENLTIYHSMGAGITGDFCENVTETNVRIIPNREKGRVFSTEADAQHYRNCKGLIWFNGCESKGQADDFVNIQGVYYKITAVPEAKSISIVKGRNHNPASHDFSPGETVAFLNPESGQRKYRLTVESVTDKDVIFNEDVPTDVDSSWYVENYTWTPSFIFENCKVPKGNRARGVLCTTPRQVIIRNNWFHSAGTPILIEGDIDYWFEAGACTDVDIYGNTFDNCLTSGNRDGNRWQWGDGIITITPSHRPADAYSPAYHRNIRIHDNVFKVFDTHLMRACSVDGLEFIRNKIVRTYDYKPYLYYKDSFTLEGCRNVVIRKNSFSKDYNVRTIGTRLMNPGDVKASKEFTVHSVL